mmetsp:Transcript_1011/g.2783  ORF Transcript_1011/g.2783 Transcript_1011/m.2783 type:complete len:209 (-) Transcript_1011:1071-1697(-)
MESKEHKTILPVLEGFAFLFSLIAILATILSAKSAFFALKQSSTLLGTDSSNARQASFFKSFNARIKDRINSNISSLSYATANSHDKMWYSSTSRTEHSASSVSSNRESTKRSHSFRSMSLPKDDCELQQIARRWTTSGRATTPCRTWMDKIPINSSTIFKQTFSLHLACRSLAEAFSQKENSSLRTFFWFSAFAAPFSSTKRSESRA